MLIFRLRLRKSSLNCVIIILFGKKFTKEIEFLNQTKIVFKFTALEKNIYFFSFLEQLLSPNANRFLSHTEDLRTLRVHRSIESYRTNTKGRYPICSFMNYLSKTLISYFLIAL